MKYVAIILFFIGLFALSCQSTPEISTDQATTGIQTAMENPVMEVAIAQAVQGDFETSIQAQGQLRANEKMELVWNAQGYITELSVQNGDQVEAGMELARLSTLQLGEDLRQAEINLEKARLAREDMLISGKLDSTSLEADKRDNIDLLSGYRQAEYDIEKIEKQITKQLINAPFEGIVFDIQQVAGAYVSPGKSFAKLVNNKNFQVEFQVLESDLGNLQKGQAIEVQPLAGQFKPFNSTIHRIIPIVNSQGLVTILANARGNAGAYYDGMKVQVQVMRSLPDQIIVPREALVIRSGRKVIFVYDPVSRLAKWHYVTTGSENESSVTITDGIEAGDQVIIEGNLNLSHDAEVVVKSLDQSTGE